MISAAYLWSLLALFFQYGANIILLPILSHFLTASEIGLWYAIQLAYALSLLLEFGFQTSFARSVSYVNGGAQSLTATGFGGQISSPDVNLGLMSAVLRSIELKYKVIAILMVGTLLSAGTGYIYFVSREYGHQSALLLSWVVFVLLAGYSFFWTNAIPVLNGLGRVAHSQKLATQQKVLAIGATTLALASGGGLCGAMLGWALGNAVILFTGPRSLRNEAVVVTARGVPPHELSNVIKSISLNANKVGSSAIGTFFLLRGTSFLASFFLSLPQFGIYSISIQIFQAISNLARLKFTVDLPKLSILAARNALHEFRRIVLQGVLVGWLVYGLSILGLLVFGTQLLALLNKSLPSLTFIDAALIAAFYFMEITHGSCAIAITLLNIVPYVSATWMSTAAILIGSAMVGYFTSWGLTGFLVVQLSVQMAYNAWKWPLQLYYLTQENES